MSGRGILFALLIPCWVWGTPQSLPFQEMRLRLEELSFQVNSLKVELGLVQEKLGEGEKKSPSQAENSGSLERRIGQLEKKQESITSDLKTLKNHLNEACTTLARLENEQSNDIKMLKKSLESVLSLLQGGAAPGSDRTHIVRSGDSLGLIAQEYKTDIKTLKKLNHLEKDTIFVGQKLLVP